MTIIEIYGGDMCGEKIRVRCNLTEASAPVQVDWCNDDGEGWCPTQYQCADASHRTSGLADIGMELAARAMEIAEDEFAAKWREIDEEAVPCE